MKKLASLLAAFAGAAAAVFAIGADAHRAAHAAPAPPPEVKVVSDEARALREVLVHYVPEDEDTFAPTYRDFLGTLPESTHLVVVHPAGAGPKAASFVGGISPALLGRTRMVEIATPMGIWSKDRALVLADRSPVTTFLVPPRPRPGESGRPLDWDIIPAVAKAMPGRFAVKQLPIAFDAGDFAVAGDRVIFDDNLWTRNKARGYPSQKAFRERMKMLVGRDVVMLGADDGDVPRHHMSMYMAPLDGDTVLVGDPALGAKIVGPSFQPGESSKETDRLLEADTSAATIARFERAAADLKLAGFRVVRIPTIAFDDKTYFAYTNGVYETRNGKRVVWMPTFASGDDPLVADLDAAARAVYESLGYEVKPVTVRKLYTSHGTIGCVVNVLSRE